MYVKFATMAPLENLPLPLEEFAVQMSAFAFVIDPSIDPCRHPVRASGETEHRCKERPSCIMYAVGAPSIYSEGCASCIISHSLTYLCRASPHCIRCLLKALLGLTRYSEVILFEGYTRGGYTNPQRRISIYA